MEATAFAARERADRGEGKVASEPEAFHQRDVLEGAWRLVGTGDEISYAGRGIEIDAELVVVADDDGRPHLDRSGVDR